MLDRDVYISLLLSSVPFSARVVVVVSRCDDVWPYQLEQNFVRQLREGGYASASTVGVIVPERARHTAPARLTAPSNFFDAHKQQLEQRQEQEIADSVMSSWGEVLNLGRSRARGMNGHIRHAIPPSAIGAADPSDSNFAVGGVRGGKDSDGSATEEDPPRQDEEEDEEVELDTATFLNMSSGDNGGSDVKDEDDVKEGDQICEQQRQQQKEQQQQATIRADAPVSVEITAATTTGRKVRGDRHSDNREIDVVVDDPCVRVRIGLAAIEKTTVLPHGGSRMLPLSVIAPASQQPGKAECDVGAGTSGEIQRASLSKRQKVQSQ